MSAAVVHKIHPPLRDQHGRQKRKLRISITDRCNFRCSYCMPEQPTWLKATERLTQGEIVQLAEHFVRNGITHIRLTGGEPTLHPELVELVRNLSGLRAAGLEKLSLTTNASLLEKQAEPLRRAGLDDINISLDTLQPERFAELGGHANLATVLAGIQAAKTAGFPIKLNAVLINGHNDDEILALTQWAMQQKLPLRFIEFMPLEGGGFWHNKKVVPAAQVLQTLRQHFVVTRQPQGSDPARYWRLNDDYILGFISTISEPFCGSCDRLRLTAKGELYTCLFAQNGTPLRQHLNNPNPDSPDLETVIRTAVWNKGQGYAETGLIERPITMHTLGG